MPDPTSSSEAARGGREFQPSEFLIFEGITVVNLRNPDAQLSLAVLEAMALGQLGAREALSATPAGQQFTLAVAIASDLSALVGVSRNQFGHAIISQVLAFDLQARITAIEEVYGPVFASYVLAYVEALLADPGSGFGPRVKDVSFPMPSPLGVELTQEEFEAIAQGPMNFGPQFSNPGAGWGGTSTTSPTGFATIDSNGNITNTVTGQLIGHSTFSAPPANDPSTATNPGLDGPW